MVAEQQGRIMFLLSYIILLKLNSFTLYIFVLHPLLAYISSDMIVEQTVADLWRLWIKASSRYTLNHPRASLSLAPEYFFPTTIYDSFEVLIWSIIEMHSQYKIP